MQLQHKEEISDRGYQAGNLEPNGHSGETKINGKCTNGGEKRNMVDEGIVTLIRFGSFPAEVAFVEIKELLWKPLLANGRRLLDLSPFV